MNMQGLNLRLQRLFIGGVGLNARCWGRWESCLTDSRFLWLIKNESCSTILDRLFSEVDSESEQINRCFDSKQKYPSPYLFIPFKMTQTKRYIINFFPGASPCQKCFFSVAELHRQTRVNHSTSLCGILPAHVFSKKQESQLLTVRLPQLVLKLPSSDSLSGLVSWFIQNHQSPAAGIHIPDSCRIVCHGNPLLCHSSSGEQTGRTRMVSSVIQRLITAFLCESIIVQMVFS